MNAPSCSYDTADTAAIMGGLYGDGIIACRGAFPTEWVQDLGRDIAALYATARATSGGALARGPNRFYVEIHPQRLRGFADIVTHPWIVAVCEAILGPDYRIVEAGFDVPGPGALTQPWHRDFAAPLETIAGRRLNSLAFNIPTVDITDDMGPLEIVPGTQWDLWQGDPMFPPAKHYARFEQRCQRRLARAGDMAARSALTVHRGTANRSSSQRPVFVLGVDAPDAINGARHDLQLTQAYFDSLPAQARAHLDCRIVAELEPIVQAHSIAGLLMGAPA